MRFCTGTVTAAALVLAACSTPPTQVVVQLVADPAIEAESARVAVEVVSPGGELTRRIAERGETPDHEWPFRVVIVPARADSDRFLVTAEVFDAGGASLGVQRAHAQFFRGQTRYVRLRFTDGCRDVRCQERQTCADGACASACVEPTRDPETAPSMGPCLQTRPLMDAGASDGGLPLDGAIPDGGPPAVPCPEGDLSTLDFEAPLSLPRCPGGIPCETSPTGRVERVESGSALAPPAPSPCGVALLRASVFSSASRNAGYVVSEGGPHLRAWLWLPSAGAEQIEAKSDLLAIVAGDATRDLDAPRVALQIDAGRLQVVSEAASADVGEAPAGRWVCASLSVTEGEARVHVDGLEATLPVSASLAAALGEGSHTRVGIASAGAGENALVWVDQVAVSGGALPCAVP